VVLSDTKILSTFVKIGELSLSRELTDDVFLKVKRSDEAH